jgi:hypothetical protein
LAPEWVFIFGIGTGIEADRRLRLPVRSATQVRCRLTVNVGEKVVGDVRPRRLVLGKAAS